MARLLTDDPNAQSKNRLVGIRLAALTIGLRASWTELFGDSDSAAIVLAMVVISSERLLRQELGPDLQTLATQIPPELLGSCNISSIATATGLNRETVRRKVGHLVVTGLI